MFLQLLKLGFILGALGGADETLIMPQLQPDLPQSVIDALQVEENPILSKFYFYNEKMEKVNSKSLIGKVLIFYICNPWDMESQLTLKKLNNLNNWVRDQDIDNIQIIPILGSCQQNLALKNFFTAVNITSFPIFCDKDNQMSDVLGVYNTPYTIVVDKVGRILFAINTYIDWGNVALRNLLVQFAS